MKKTLSIIFSIWTATQLFAQQVPNGGFENWTNPLAPDGWADIETAAGFPFNVVTFKDTVDKVEGTASIKMVTDTVHGYSNGQVTPSLISLGGLTLGGTEGVNFIGYYFPYRPDTLIFWYKYTSPATDTAAVFFEMRYGVGDTTDVIDKTTLLFPGNNWVLFTEPLDQYYLNGRLPDTLLLQFISSKGVNPVIGSTLHLDGFRLGYGCKDTPVALCKNAIVMLDTVGQGSVPIADIDAGSRAGCGLQSISISKNTFTCADAGINNITLTATDYKGGVSHCPAIVTVLDTSVPHITCPGNLAATGTGNLGMVNNGKAFTIASPAASAICGISSVTNSFNHTSNASGFYPVGVTDVLWTAANVSGLTTSCTQVVTVYNSLGISSTITNAMCPATSTGTINIRVSGGTLPYVYNWSNGVHGPNNSGLGTGTYKVTVTDATSGSVTASFTVGISLAPSRPNRPGIIFGPFNLCPNTIAVYSIAAVTYATSYQWTVPSQCSIVYGQGTTSIVVRTHAIFNAGVIEVGAKNCAGIGALSGIRVSGQVHCHAKTDEEENTDTLSLPQPGEEFKVMIYPNPFTTQFNIHIESGSDEPISLRVYDLAGRLIEEAKQAYRENEMEIGNTLATGIYLVQIQQADKLKVLRIIKI